ncbi:MAG: OadG family protein [Chloroflexota bacterium]|nr:OadG family protein [Chloroflexota bacterium]
MSEFQYGLLITAIGMGLVFAVIIFLWGLMALMMRMTSGRKHDQSPAGDEPITDAPMVAELKTAEGQRRAAAAAVAVRTALSAKRKTDMRGIEDRRGDLSPWQAIHRPQHFKSTHRRG